MGWKTRENVVVLDFLAVYNFDFTRKIVKKIGWKTRENVGVLSKLNFWTKFDLSNSVRMKTMEDQKWYENYYYEISLDEDSIVWYEEKNKQLHPHCSALDLFAMSEMYSVVNLELAMLAHLGTH